MAADNSNLDDARRARLADALIRSGQGDRSAFEAVYKATSAKLFGVCLRIFPDRNEAEEALQDAYLTIWNKAASFESGRASPISWLVAVTRNRAIDRLRARGSAGLTSLDEAAEVADPAPLVDAKLLADSEDRILHGCIDGLDRRDSHFIRCAFIGGATYADLAAREGEPLGTVKSRIRRALIKLRTCMEGRFMTNLSEDDIALAGEYVLGLLDAAGEATANARIATDSAFAAEVEAWCERLAPMLAGDEAVPAHIWDAVQRGLPSPTGQDVGSGKLLFWRTLTGISVSAAAILGILLLQKPEAVAPPVPAPATPMIAALGSDTGNASLTASYDADTGRMIVTPVSLDTGKLYPELWVIPADGTPRSLGIIDAEGAMAMTITADMRQHISAGSTLAITPEPATGAPGGKPSGPILASGQIGTI